MTDHGGQAQDLNVNGNLNINVNERNIIQVCEKEDI